MKQKCLPSFRQSIRWAAMFVFIFFPTTSQAVCVDKPENGITCDRNQANVLNPAYILNENEQQLVRQCYDPRFEIFNGCGSNRVPQYSEQQRQGWEKAWKARDEVLAQKYGMKHLSDDRIYGCLANISHRFCNHPIISPDNPCYDDLVDICVHAVAVEKDMYKQGSARMEQRDNEQQQRKAAKRKQTREEVLAGLASGKIHDYTSDAEFVKYCSDMTKLRPAPMLMWAPGGPFQVDDPNAVIKEVRILYTAPTTWEDGPTKGRKVYNTYVVLMSIDNIHYYPSSISCSLPFGDKGVEYSWGGWEWWGDDFHYALIQILEEQKLAGFVDAIPGEYRCFFTTTCKREAYQP